jgi:hypothetical protein
MVKGGERSMSGGVARVNPREDEDVPLHPDARPDPTDPTRSQFTEGLARVVFPRNAPVFYNKAQVP